MRKYLYLIKKKKIKSWLKFWLLTKDQVKYILSEILEGFSFNLQNTVKKRFKIFNIFGNSVQNGTPSPDNPVPIESVADDVNLFDEPKVLRTAAGLTFTYNNKKIKLTGTAGATYFGTNNILQNIKAGTYIFSTTNTNSNLTYNMWLYNSSNQLIGNTKVNNPVTISEDATYYVLFVEGLTNGTTYNEEVNVKLQKGTTATPYSPYNQGTFTIDFEGQTENYNYTFITSPLRSLPNGVKDSLEDDGIHRRVGRVVLDGSEGWDNYTAVSGNIVQCRLMLSSNCKSRVGLSDRFLVIADYSATEHIVIGGALNNAVFIHINKSRLSTEDITGFKNWLSTHNIEVLYELETEVIEPYTEEQQAEYNKIKELYTFDGTTNIYSTDVVPPYLQIQYYMKGE